MAKKKIRGASAGRTVALPKGPASLRLFKERRKADRRVVIVARKVEARSVKERRGGKEFRFALDSGPKGWVPEANFGALAAGVAFAGAITQKELRDLVVKFSDFVDRMKPKPPANTPTKPGAADMSEILRASPSVPDKLKLPQSIKDLGARVTIPKDIAPQAGTWTQNQKVKVGTKVTLAVTVTDVNGKPVEKAVVTFAVSAGMGKVFDPSTTDSGIVIRRLTDSNGQTDVRWQIGDTPGDNLLVASAAGVSKEFTATGKP